MSELAKLLEELTLPLGGESNQLALAIEEIETLWAKVERLEANEKTRTRVDRALILEVMAEHLVTKEEALEALRSRGGP